LGRSLTRVREQVTPARITRRGLIGTGVLAGLLLVGISVFASPLGAAVRGAVASPARLATGLTPALEQSGLVALARDAAAETQEGISLLVQDVESAVRPLLPGGSAAVARARAARAYRNAFGHSMDEDLPDYKADVDAWVRQWQAAYDAGEPWAWSLLADPAPR
jgi:hypothetical protein